MSKELAERALAHLERYNLVFCFLPDGSLVTRESCRHWIELHDEMKKAA